MSIKDEIKIKFESGSTPTQLDFESLIDFCTNAGSLDLGELSNERLPREINVNSVSADGSALTNLTAGNLTGSLPSSLVMDIDASKVNSGKLLNDQLPDDITVNSVNGNGSGLTQLLASAIEGTVSPSVIPELDANKISTGEIHNDRLPQDIIVNSIRANGAAITSINPNNISGVLPAGVIPGLDAGKIVSGKLEGSLLPLDIIADSFSGDGSGLMDVAAEHISGGLLSNEHMQKASETQEGISRFANTNEAQQVDIADKAISPKQLAYVMSQREQSINDQLALVKAGLKFRDDVCVVAVSSIDKSSALEIDGYEIQDGDRVLLTNQIDANENTVWIANAYLPWEIAEDLDNDIEGEMAIGISVEVTGGNEYANTYWSVASIDNGIVWKKRNDLNDFNAGEGIVINGLTISADEQWVKGQCELTAGEGVRLEESVVSLDETWIKQVGALDAGPGITLQDNTVSVNEPWVKEVARLNSGTGILLQDDDISVNETWVKEVASLDAGEGISVQNDIISIDQVGLLSALSTRLGPGLAIVDNVIKLDESWLNEKIREQINLSQPILPEAIPMMAAPDALLASPSVIMPKISAIKYQTLDSKPTLNHMENLSGHGVYSINVLKNSAPTVLAYFENGSNNIKLFDLESKSQVGEITLSARPSHVEYSPIYDALFYSMGGKLYQLSKNNEPDVFIENVNDFFFSAGGSRCIARQGNSLKVVDMSNKDIIRDFTIDISGRTDKTTLGSSYNGEFVAVSSGYKNQSVQIFNIKTGESNIITIEGASATYSPTPSEDGQEVYVGGGFSDGHVYVYDVSTAKLLRKYKPFSGYVYQVKPTADPRFVVMGGYNGVLKILNIQDGSQWWSSEHVGHINEVTVSPDLKRIYVASGAGDARFSIFDIN